MDLSSPQWEVSRRDMHQLWAKASDMSPLYSFPTAGLDAENGQVLGMLEAEDERNLHLWYSAGRVGTHLQGASSSGYYYTTKKETLVYLSPLTYLGLFVIISIQEVCLTFFWVGNAYANYLEATGLRTAAAAKSLQSCLTLCDPIDSSPHSIIIMEMKDRLPCPWDSPGKNTGVGCHFLLQCMKVKSENEVAQSCLTLSDPMDCSLPVSSAHGIFQARVLEWVAMAFSNAWKWKVKVKSLSRVRHLATPWTAAYQAPPSMGFSRQEYWRGVPLPSPNIISIINQIL